MRLLRSLLPLAVVAVLATACGGGSSSSPTSSSSGPSGTVAVQPGALEVRPVYARYAPGVPLGAPQLGPTVPTDLVSAMKHYDCSSKPTQLQGMLMVCDTGKTVFLLKDPIISGDVATAQAKQIGHSQLWWVKVALDQQGTATLKGATTTLAGSELAFVLNDQVLSAPVIDSSMTGGHIGITGNYHEQQAKQIASKLNAN